MNFAPLILLIEIKILLSCGIFPVNPQILETSSRSTYLVALYFNTPNDVPTFIKAAIAVSKCARS